MQRKTGFTYVDLVAVLVLVVVASAIAATVLPTTQQASLAARCGGNLKLIYTGMTLYATENNNRYPILPDMDGKKPLNYRDELKMGSDCLASELGQGAQQNLSLLVKYGSVGWAGFRCPATGTQLADRTPASSLYGVGDAATGKTYIDYAVQIPYAITPDGKNACPVLNTDVDGKIVILADRGPRTGFDAQWSPNHADFPGEDVLYADGHVEWSGPDQGKPNAAGYDKNNIYTADKWAMKGANPTLISNGTENKTPTDLNGKYDSVLYHHWGPNEAAGTTQPATGPAVR